MELALETCVLRPWRPEDAEALARNANEREIARNMRDAFPHSYSLEHANEWPALDQHHARPERGALRARHELVYEGETTFVDVSDAAPGAGEYRLTLHLQGGAHQEQFLFDDVVLEGGDAPWEHELHTGKLRIDGIGPWQGDGPPRAVHLWRGPGQLFSVAVPVGSSGSAVALDVPAGPAELRAPGESMDPDSWKTLRTIDVPRGGELRVELTPAEASGR